MTRLDLSDLIHDFTRSPLLRSTSMELRSPTRVDIMEFAADGLQIGATRKARQPPMDFY
ncbi:Hypothetical predicted protein, partial [Prunus dulcis]